MEKIKQDMPPQGGYGPINYKRVPMKSGMGIPLKLAAVFTITGVGFYLVRVTKFRTTVENIEMRCARTALSPMLLAEVDRMYLKQIRKNRDEEAKIMENVKDWEVGKYLGRPVYSSLAPDEYYPASPLEFYAHAGINEMYRAFNFHKL